MSTERPQINDDPMYRLLRDGAVDEFNTRRAGGEECNLRGCDFRHLDLRQLDARGLDLRDCYFRQSDLRGVDLSETQLEGASINAASPEGEVWIGDVDLGSLTDRQLTRLRRDRVGFVFQAFNLFPGLTTR